MLQKLVSVQSAAEDQHIIFIINVLNLFPLISGQSSCLLERRRRHARPCLIHHGDT